MPQKYRNNNNSEDSLTSRRTNGGKNSGQSRSNNNCLNISTTTTNMQVSLFPDSRELSASQLHLLLHPTEGEEDEALRKSEDLMCLNVGGKKHWVMARNFVNFPGTRLGKLARSKSK